MITEEEMLSEFQFRCPRGSRYEIFKYAVEWAQYRMHVQSEFKRRREQEEND
jgi:hypothetical protein